MSRSYRNYRNSDEQVDDMIAASRQRELNRREWNKRAFKFAEDGDYATARANLEQAAAIRT